MEWILDNLKLVVFVVIILIYAIKAMKAKSAEDGDGAAPTRRAMPGEHDAAEAERTRQIQEEIRRRILARQRGETAAPPPPEVFESEPEQVEGPQTLRPVIVAERAGVEEDAYAREDQERAAREAGMLETQRTFEEQLRQLRAVRELATAAIPKMGAARTFPGPERRSAALPGSWRAELAGRGSLRRAIILREILGEPVGMRRGAAGTTHR